MPLDRQLGYWAGQFTARRISRREFIGRALALGASLATAEKLVQSAAQAASPRKGGLFKQALSSGNTTDSLDPITFDNSVVINIARQIYSALVRIDPHTNLAVPDLAEAWESYNNATEWLFLLRKDVTFHNGKSLTADDVIYSLQIHMGPQSGSAAQAVLSNIETITAEGPHAVRFRLKSGNADMPYLLTDYHIMVVPEGFSDWDHPIGTGPYAFEHFEPGVRALTTKYDGYFREDVGHVEAVETLVINDASSRLNALRSGVVHAISRLSPKLVRLMRKEKGLGIRSTPSGRHYTFAAHVDEAPFNDNHVRMALKLGLDRHTLVNKILRGFGREGNDTPISVTSPFYNWDLPQRVYDPEKARWHLKQAGMENLSVNLSASTAAYAEALDAASLYRESAREAGIDINVIRESPDGYWKNVWLVKPFKTVFWYNRPTPDMIFSLGYSSGAPWNDTHWHRPAFDRMMRQARVETDFEKRRAIYNDMQEMLYNEGGVIVPMFADNVDALQDTAKGYTPSAEFELCGHRFHEYVWLEE